MEYTDGKNNLKLDFSAIRRENERDSHPDGEERARFEASMSRRFPEGNLFYDLLLFAEREKAEHVVIEIDTGSLVFYHSGNALTEADARAILSPLTETGSRIPGFSWIHKYSFQPELYSDDLAFAIEEIHFPKEIPGGFDKKAEAEKLRYPDLGKPFMPFIGAEHLTKVLLPLEQISPEGEMLPVSGKDLLEGLEGLPPETLLFLDHVKDLYWINKRNGKFTHFRKKSSEEKESKEDIKGIEDRKGLVTLESSGMEEERSVSYLYFEKKEDLPETGTVKYAAAFLVHPEKDSVGIVENAPLYALFPEKKMSGFPFLLSGSVEDCAFLDQTVYTEPLRQKLFSGIGDLLSETVKVLAEKSYLTEEAIRHLYLPMVREEENLIPDLGEKITEVFRKGAFLPDRSGALRKAEELRLPLPSTIGNLAEMPFFSDLFKDLSFVSVTGREEESNLNYVSWLREKLTVRPFTLMDLSERLFKAAPKKGKLSLEERESLWALYRILAGFRITPGAPSPAWEKLRQAPVLLNREGELSPAMKDGETVLYLSPEGKGQISDSALVDERAEADFRTLLTGAFGLVAFDPFRELRELVSSRYAGGEEERIFVEDLSAFLPGYQQDMTRILELFEKGEDPDSIREILKDACLIKVLLTDAGSAFVPPRKACFESSDEGIDLGIYYAPVPEAMEEEDPDGHVRFHPGELMEFSVSVLDTDFYGKLNFPLEKLRQFGLRTTPVIPGDRSGKDGLVPWKALGEFCPNLELDGLAENLEFISTFPGEELAQKKSRILLELLLRISGRTQGEIRRGESNPSVERVKCRKLFWMIGSNPWLYDQEGKIHTPGELSWQDLSESLYPNLPDDRDAFLALGFLDRDAEEMTEAVKAVSDLTRGQKISLLRSLARELGYDVFEQTEEDESGEKEEASGRTSLFPERFVRSMGRLHTRVREQFFCIDPVRYGSLLSRIREISPEERARSYVLEMYASRDRTFVCQICRRSTAFVDVTPLLGYGGGMPQLNLCLCKSCAPLYKTLRDGGRENVNAEITRAVRGKDVSKPVREYVVRLPDRKMLHFTQQHLAEAQELLGLLGTYGLPGSEAPAKPSVKAAPLEKAFQVAAPSAGSASARQIAAERKPQAEMPAPSLPASSPVTPARVEPSAPAPAAEAAPTKPEEPRYPIHVGTEVLHKSFGLGSITEITGLCIYVRFGGGEVKKFANPMCFERGFLKLREKEDA